MEPAGSCEPAESEGIAVDGWRQTGRGLMCSWTAKPGSGNEDEVESCLEQATAAGMERGLSRQDACRAAKLNGQPIARREQVREYGWESSIDALLACMRYAIRRLSLTPSFSGPLHSPTRG